MYKCDKCGNLTEELKAVKEKHNFWGANTYVEIEDYHCECGGEYFEAFECEICGEYYYDEDMVNKACAKCLSKKVTVENVFKYIEDNGLEVEFYCEYYLDSKVEKCSGFLLELCKNNWNEAYNNPYTTVVAKTCLFDFIAEDIEPFEEWVLDNEI